jgi:RNA polymerase sigma-54 factor
MEMMQGAAMRQRQSLSMKINPAMIQSVHLMELSMADLRACIEEEVGQNPALEVERDNLVESLDNLNQAANDARERSETPSDTPVLQRHNGEEASNNNRSFIEGALSRPETLRQHLLSELSLETCDNQIRQAAELIIGNLSPDGFHLVAPDILLQKFPQRARDVALEVVRRLEPAGCGTANWEEALEAQATLRYGENVAQDMRRLFPYLRDIDRNNLPALARHTKLKQQNLPQLIEKMKYLSPFPGRQFPTSTVDTRYVAPDVLVTRAPRDEAPGRFSIVINDEALPVLEVSASFLRNADAGDKEQRDFIRENVARARLFMSALSRRNATIFRVASFIVRRQRRFFKRGLTSLVPLTMKDAAEELNLHEATISRATRGKYMQTEWGIFEFRFFFSGQAGVKTTNTSKSGAKEIIRILIADENGKAMSDAAIVEALRDRGITLARRTVAKYRKELNIDSSFGR